MSRLRVKDNKFKSFFTHYLFVGGGYVSMLVGFCGSHRSMLLASLFVVVLLVSSLFAGIFMMNICSGSFLDGAVHVKNEVELKNAINSVPDGKSTTIALGKDITLTEVLKIPVDKDITLKSDKAVGYYKLIGAEGASTIFVDDGGVLRLETPHRACQLIRRPIDQHAFYHIEDKFDSYKPTEQF
jgi:hypothetical protein